MLKDVVLKNIFSAVNPGCCYSKKLCPICGGYTIFFWLWTEPVGLKFIDSSKQISREVFWLYSSYPQTGVLVLHLSSFDVGGLIVTGMLIFDNKRLKTEMFLFRNQLTQNLEQWIVKKTRTTDGWNLRTSNSITFYLPGSCKTPVLPVFYLK